MLEKNAAEQGGPGEISVYEVRYQCMIPGRRRWCFDYMRDVLHAISILLSNIPVEVLLGPLTGVLLPNADVPVKESRSCTMRRSRPSSNLFL